VGINHYPPQYPSLKGCVNDALMMAQILMGNFGFVAGDDMRMLTDERATKQAILDRLDWLVTDAQPGDILVFHYSGHGAQVPARDESGAVDHVDECLCPYDFTWDNPLLDQDMQKVINRIPDDANLTNILDCCHSGRQARALGAGVPSTPRRLLPPPDIRFRAVQDIQIDLGWTNQSVTMTEFRDLEVRRVGATMAEKGILVAGCKAEQLSNDAWIDNDYHGALTYALYQALQDKGPTKIYSDWVSTATDILKSKYHIQDQEPELDAPEDEKSWQLFTTAPAAPAPVRAARAVANKHLVYVHGICPHQPGYSEPWWAAMQPYVPSLSDANRHEVLWSQVVHPANRALVVPAKNQGLWSQMIKEILADRAQRQSLTNLLKTAGGKRSLESVVLTRAFLDIPGLDCIDDFMQYLLQTTIRDQVINCFNTVVKPLLDQGSEVEIISHSWGTVVAYEALRRMDALAAPGWVQNLFTVGSALSIPPVRALLESPGGDPRPKPNLVKRWINLDAHGDIVGGPLKGYFRVDDEFLELDPYGCNAWLPSPACAHGSYFQMGNAKVNRDIFGEFIEGT
jgi:hypothetical protein